MESIDLELVQRREQKTRQFVQRSSPFYVWSGQLGIVIVAANKDPVDSRIGKIMDRMACVSRGEQRASSDVHQLAALTAYSIAFQLSRGDVMGGEVAEVISRTLGASYHHYLGDPMRVESCIVQLNATPERDYLALVEPDGTLVKFARVLYRGKIGSDDTDGESTGTGTRREQDEPLARLNDRLVTQWQDHPNITSLMDTLSAVAELSPLLSSGVRRDIVLLDRTALRARQYEQVFKRLAL
jgi:hypothetical protein